MLEDVEVVSPVKELTPEQKDIASIFVSNDPVAELRRVSKVMSGKKFRHKEMVSLKERAGTGAGKTTNALDTLTWRCLPRLNQIVGEFKGLGVDDREVLELAFDGVREAINNWRPAEKPVAPKDNLPTHVYLYARQKLIRLVADKYGVKIEDFPVVRLYFRARTLFKKEHGRGARQSDFEELARIVRSEAEDVLKNKMKGLFREEEEQEIGLIPHRRELRVQEDAWGDDKLRKIHDHYLMGDFSSYDEVGDQNADKNPEEVANLNELKTIMNKLVGGLRGEEKRVVDLRFGLSSGEEKTQEEVAEEMGISLLEMKKLLTRALRKLRYPDNSRRIRDF